MKGEHSMEQIKEKLRQIADEHMINELRFIDAEALEPKDLFAGRQPKDLMPEAKSLIVSGIYIGGFHFPEEGSDEYGRMSRLTLSGFYWNVVEPLKPLRDHLIAQGYQAIIYDGIEEDNCVPLKPAAVKAGLGWQGKNTLLINKEYGSFQALGGIITDADIAETYPSEEDHCGSCSACAESCPAGALDQRKLNRSKCLSNLLEEDNMPETVTEMPDNYFFECDICQEACPWNKKHLTKPMDTKIDDAFVNKQEQLMELLRFDTLLSMGEETYREKILPLLTGVDLPYSLFQRNVRLAYRFRHKQEVE
jgi:epoxyqueuosine reductase QueG